MSDATITIVLQAAQYTGDVKKLPQSFQKFVKPEHETENCFVEVPSGTQLCRPTDYLMNAPDGSMIVLKQEQFEKLKKQTENGEAKT